MISKKKLYIKKKKLGQDDQFSFKELEGERREREKRREELERRWYERKKNGKKGKDRKR